MASLFLILYILSVFGTFFAVVLFTESSNFDKMVDEMIIEANNVSMGGKYGEAMRRKVKIFKIWTKVYCLIPVVNIVLVYVLGHGIKSGNLKEAINSYF